MICDNCGKEPATVHYKEMREDQTTEYHLCEKCAAEKGIQITPSKKSFTVSNILAGMAEEVGSDLETCENCGLTYREFKESGRLGCARCYESFKEQLSPLLRRIHGSNVHTGKSPSSRQHIFEKRREIGRLKEELDAAIEREEFEKAAELRDKLKGLECAEPGGEESA
jgi:protein arginine kinase activator